MRPANIVTAISDVLAGTAIMNALAVSAFNVSSLLWIIASTSCLYGGGVVMNDVFDADLDAIERPERPIPSGLIKKTSAATVGLGLLIAGIVCATFSHQGNPFSSSTLVATIIALAALTYDKWAKHHAFFGPLTMGLCRGCNLVLGMTVLLSTELWMLGVVPLLYIFAITMISRGEVHGGKRTTLYIAAMQYLFVILVILFIAFIAQTLLMTLPFVLFFSLMIFLPLQKAIQKPEGALIGRAVKSGVISLIIMNASWAAAADNLTLALITIALLPVSLLLARLFAVT